MKTRRPAVAGRFYPGTALEIEKQLSEILQKELPAIDLTLAKNKIIGTVLPHAGYMFSAYEAIHFFEILKHSEQRFDTFVIINPNHTGYGQAISLDENEFWETPLGKVEIDRDFYHLLDFPQSAAAHKFEHSGEVMVPLLQYTLSYNFRILPVTMSLQTQQHAEKIAAAIHSASLQLNRRICWIASSDFSHYVAPEEGKRLDGYVLSSILELNPAGIFREVKERHITVCGYGPIMSLIEYARLVSGKPKARILRSGNSGEIMPSDEVVDYVSILFYEE